MLEMAGLHTLGAYSTALAMWASILVNNPTVCTTILPRPVARLQGLAI